MLKTTLIHPPLLAALAAAGHGSLVLIADSNYPASTRRGPNADVIHLNLGPGTVDAVTILRHLLTVVPVEETFVMEPMTAGPYAMTGQPEIWQEFRDAFAAARVDGALQPIERNDFYTLASGADVAITIVSGESRIYGNLLLRIGVVLPSG